MRDMHLAKLMRELEHVHRGTLLLHGQAERAQGLCEGFEMELNSCAEKLRDERIATMILHDELRAAELTVQPFQRNPDDGGGLRIVHLQSEVTRLRYELKAAVEATEMAQRAAADAQEFAAQQNARSALELRRQRERLKADHQAEMATIWAQFAGLTSDEGVTVVRPQDGDALSG